MGWVENLFCLVQGLFSLTHSQKLLRLFRPKYAIERIFVLPQRLLSSSPVYPRASLIFSSPTICSEQPDPGSDRDEVFGLALDLALSLFFPVQGLFNMTQFQTLLSYDVLPPTPPPPPLPSPKGAQKERTYKQIDVN